MTIQTLLTLGEVRLIPLRDLRLDGDNPRLPEGVRNTTQEDLAVTMALGFDAFTVAESIATHGYFQSEPLIAVPDPEHGTYVVVEGNRRLTALLGLADPGLRAEFAESDKWNELAARTTVGLDMVVPVAVAPSRRAALPIVGFRHIGGIMSWKPYAQARYIAKLVDGDDMSFQDVSEMIGIDRSKVAGLYRDQGIAVQAGRLGIETGDLERSFSLLTVAMSTKLREHIGAPVSSAVARGADPVPPDKQDELREALTWIFGDGTQPPVIEESRSISRLSNVASSPTGLASLRKGESLDMALQRVKDATDDPLGRLTRRLKAGRSALTAALEDVSEFAGNEEVRILVDEVRDAASALESAIEEPAEAAPVDQ